MTRPEVSDGADAAATSQETGASRAGAPGANPRRAVVALAALGIVFGDLGTSPLYALQEAFHPGRGVVATPDNIVGALSLFLWSLLAMVSFKYVFLLMRADNDGEGGILALLALLTGGASPRGAAGRRGLWLALGLVGTAMLYGDGAITPAISVLSAVEGLSVATPAFAPYVVPLTVVILATLFAFQSRGSGRMGVAFGPILALWFLVIALLGVRACWEAPEVWCALDPREAASFFRHNGFRGFEALGAVVLCLTGGEALYADMGHFGRGPIRLAWYGLALPALVLNYAGQAALLLRHPGLADHPFYAMVPAWALYPMVAVATLATIVASQALITAVFSLTQQAMLLGLWPRMTVVHTSSSTRGQIYMPALNALLAALTIAISIGFGSSDRLAAAFGLSVSATMAITTILFAALASQRWHWPFWRIALVAAPLLVADTAFTAANVLKFSQGGWLSFSLALITGSVMQVWRSGSAEVAASRRGSGFSIDDLVESLRAHPPLRVPGTAVFLCENSREVPGVLLHHLKHNQVLHEEVLLLTLAAADVPYVPAAQRFSARSLDLGVSCCTARFGFMESVDVPSLLRQGRGLPGFPSVDAEMSTSYYLGRDSLRIAPHWNPLRNWALRAYAVMRRNQLEATAHFGLPANRVVELGARVEVS
ncbi:MAG TPA: KUP/HAK/KT family potassium transporter [Burkholderiaceae bacterium]